MHICPYFGNVYIDQFKRDLEEIREHGFDAIVHPVTDFDIENRASNVQDLIRVTKEEGFTCFVDPHSIGALFGIGSPSSLFQRPTIQRMVSSVGTEKHQLCPQDPEFVQFMRKWVSVCEDADWVLWDEPDLSLCFCKVCRGRDVPMVQFIERFALYLERHEMKSSICFFGGRIHPETYTLAEHVDDVGVSIPPEYYLNTIHVEMWLHYVGDLSRLFNTTCSVWFPGYNIPKEHEPYIERSVKLAEHYSITHIGTWGFRGCKGWSYAACEDPDSMWASIGKAFA